MSNGPLYALGGAHPNAMKGLATGAKGNEREQDVHTPDCILDAVRKTFGGSILMDPCASRTREPIAEYNVTEDLNGLSGSWPERTYFNPPFKDLKDWLLHARKQPECIGLYPMRSNRAWWVDYHSYDVRAIAWLKPLPFAGKKQAFPAPLVLTYRGGPDKVMAFVSSVSASGLAHGISGPLGRI